MRSGQIGGEGTIGPTRRAAWVHITAAEADLLGRIFEEGQA